MDQTTAKDVKVFVPTKDFQQSLEFYQALGWKCNWREEGLAEIELTNVRLYLQNFYAKEWAENFMIYIVVESADAWHKHITEVIQKGDFPGTRVSPPKEESYGAMVTYAWDPCGVLLHFAEPVRKAKK